MRRFVIVSTLIYSVFLAGCATSSQQSAAGEPAPSIPGRLTQAQINDQIVIAFREGRYVDAIRMERLSDVPQSARDLAVGQTILQGLADPQATQRPGESIEEGIGLLEKSALQGHQPAISGLAALYSTGLPGDGKSAMLVHPDPKLNACWERAKAEPSVSASCIALRHSIRAESK